PLDASKTRTFRPSEVQQTLAIVLDQGILQYKAPVLPWAHVIANVCHNGTISNRVTKAIGREFASFETELKLQL
ncbi:hypothetical protein BGZ52_000371, partial [Haplosporangium bisporale]